MRLVRRSSCTLILLLAGPLWGQGRLPVPPEFALPPVPTEPVQIVGDQEADDEETKDDDKKYSKKDVEDLVDKILKKKDEEKKKKDEEKKKQDEEKKKADEAKKKAEEKANDHGVQFIDCELFPCAHFDRFEDESILDALFDSLQSSKDKKKWYEKLSFRGYTQIRFGRTLNTEPDSAAPNLFGDRTINGNRENFLIRRARLILSGDVSEHLSVYIQPDFGSNTDGAVNNTFFAQLRDIYADVYVDEDRVNRFRVGLSKVPYGWENMQSSQNRGPLDRTDAMNTGVSPNERDLGVFYYWTPVSHQKLLKAFVDSGLKGSGNYGIFGAGVYNGQGGSQFERNLDLHTVVRLTYPFEWACDKYMEVGVQAIRGHSVTTGAAIRPLGTGASLTPANTGDVVGHLDQRVAGTYVLYPQPFGFQVEWQVGQGPGLNDLQTAVESRHLHGGYVMGMYRHETCKHGIFMPYTRWQQYTGGYRSQANAPHGEQRELDLGLEWRLRKELELVFEYGRIDTPNFAASNTAGQRSYRNFQGDVFRIQCQFNY